MGMAHLVLYGNDIRLINPIQIIVCKLFLVAVFFATVWMVYKIAKQLNGLQVEKARLAAAVMATAPIALFAIFIFGQYDIFGVFFTAVGFYYYLKKDPLKFAIFFSIAISFKFFALIIFVPLLLLSQKNFFMLVKLGLIAISFSLFQMALYWHSKIFQHEVFDIAYVKIAQVPSQGWSLFNTGIYMAICYLGLCLYAFMKKPVNNEDWQKTAVLLCIPAYAAIFVSVAWHPQWIIIPMPFFALSLFYIKNKNIFYVVDTIGMLAFTWCMSDNFKGIETAMYSMGLMRVMGGFFEHIPLFNSDLMSSRALPFFKLLFDTYLFSPLLIIAYEKYFKLNVAADTSAPELGRNYYFMARFLVGISFFLVPTLLSALLPYSIASKINPDAYIRYLKVGTDLESGQLDAVGEIVPGFIVIQSLKAEHDKLHVIGILLATYARRNTSFVKISLLNDRDQEIASQLVNTKKLEDNSFYNFSFPTVEDSADKTYKIEITSVDGRSGNAITAWMSKTNMYPEGALTVNNVQEPGDLMFRLYYDDCPEWEKNMPRPACK
jgi:hypothetical protein